METANLKLAIRQACESALGHRVARPAATLKGTVQKYVHTFWLRFTNEGQRLLGAPTSPLMGAPESQLVVKSLLRSIACALEFAFGWLHGSTGSRGPAGQQVRDTSEAVVNVGMINAGRLGCMANYQGDVVMWGSLVDKPWSISSAFLELKFDIVGIAAARLPANFVVPGRPDWEVIARGGPSHSSVAVIWPRQGKHAFAEVVGVGSDCCIWVYCQIGRTAMLCIVFLYLPTPRDKAQDDKWLFAVAALEQDLAIARSRFPNCSVHFLLVGDWNVQPACLGAGPDPRPRRDDGFQKLLTTSDLCLLNPTLGSESPQLVVRPLTGEQIKIRTGDTHHGGGASRALDLGVASSSLPCFLTVHNGLHCKSCCDCPWPECWAMCKSDHFLLQVMCSSPDGYNKGSCEEMREVGFPDELHMAPRWTEGFNHVRPAMRCLGSLVGTCCGLPLVSAPVSRRAAVSACRWILDCLAWLQCFLANVVREGWVMPAACHRPHQACGYTRSPATHNEELNPSVVQRALRNELRQSALPLATIQRCFRFLKKPRRTPPGCMQDETGMPDMIGTHRMWCRRLAEQCKGPSEVAPAMVERKAQMCLSSLGRAWTQRGRGPIDVDVTEPMVRAVIAGWKLSRAVPPDLVPRAAFQTYDVDWILLVWRLVRLAGPTCLALRPTI